MKHVVLIGGTYTYHFPFSAISACRGKDNAVFTRGAKGTYHQETNWQNTVH